MQRFGRFAVVACLLSAACASTEDEVVYRAQPGAPERTLTREQIAGVIHTNNLFEIESSRLALERSRNQRVREYAQRMITEHQHHDQQLMELYGSPENAPYAGDLQRTGQQTIQSLRSHSNATFDRAYMDNQVTMHTWMLANLDSAFIPGSSGSTRRRLESTRDMIAGHLDLARNIRGSLGNNR